MCEPSDNMSTRFQPFLSVGTLPLCPSSDLAPQIFVYRLLPQLPFLPKFSNLGCHHLSPSLGGHLLLLPPHITPPLFLHGFHLERPFPPLGLRSSVASDTSWLCVRAHDSYLANQSFRTPLTLVIGSGMNLSMPLFLHL